MGISVGDKNVTELAVGNKLCEKGYEENAYIYGKSASRVKFSYTGSEQTFTIPKDGIYKFEVRGAAGGTDNRGHIGGNGGYACGSVFLVAGTVLKIYVGEKGKTGGGSLTDYAFNGGGRGGRSDYRSSNRGNGGGGGASDIRIGGDTLYHRLIVGGGGGGASPNRSDNQNTMCGGGESGNSPVSGHQGTQTDGFSFGSGFSSNSNGQGNRYCCNGGGGGWYGGGKGCYTESSDSWSDGNFYAGGGSGFVRTGQDYVPAGYLVSEEYILSDVSNIAGNQEMPNIDGTGVMTGNDGNGFVVISCPFFIPPKEKVTEAGAYHNPDLGLISISSNGEDWITISDKDVGAQDVLEAGKTFQYGNAYGFPGDGDSTPITTSSDVPSLTGYEGGNLYSNNTYRTNASWNAGNKNLWKGIAFNLKSLERGPCPHGFHVPVLEEIQALIQAAGSVSGEGSNVSYETLNKYLLLSHFEARQSNGGFAADTTFYLTNSYVDNQNKIKVLRIYGEEGSESVGIVQMSMNCGGYIRPFRDKAIVPTTGWTRLPSQGGTARLPHEYQEVEYIESTGTQWIDSGYIPKSTSGFEMKFQNVSAINTYRTLIGTRTDTSNNAFWIGWMNNKCYMEMSPANIEFTSSDGWFNTGIDYEMSFLNKTLICNGVTMSSSTNFTHDAQRNLYILSGNSNGQTQPFEASAAKLYYLKLYEGEDLVRDFVPCYRVGDGTAGLYDLVEGKFYTNTGTGTFIKGAPVNVWQMPEGYTELQYIQSSGASNTDGQYVDTGYMPNNNTEFELSMSNWSNASGSFQLFGQDTNRTTGDKGTSVVTDNYSWNGPNANTFTHGFRDGNFHLLLLNNSGLYRDGTLVHSGRAGQTFQSSVTCAIFCLHRGTTYTERSSYRFHYMRIRENGDVKRDYVPCVRDSDGVLGLYDLITNTFLTNQGTGSFVAGPVVFRGGFKVSPNTMLYTPMDTDLSDHSLNERSITNIGITLDTSILQNKGVGYFRGNVDYGLQFTGAEFGNNDFTISWREKTLQNSTGAGSRFSSAWHSSTWCGVLVGYNHTYLYAGDGGSSWNIVNGSQIFNSTPNTRVHRVLVKEGSSWKTYRNNVLFGSVSGSGSVGYNTSVIGNYRPGDKNPFHGYMSDFILEKKAWTDQQREDYFNATKALYGVS